MANMHIRSNSLPSKCHPVVNEIEALLCRLKSSEGEPLSVSANLARLRDSHQGIHNLIQMSSTQQALTTESSEKWTNVLLDKSLGLVDLCGFAREVLSLTKECIQETQSSVRRNRDEASLADVKNAYTTSRKKISKMVGKFIKKFDQNSTSFSSKDSNLHPVMKVLKVTDDFDHSILKSVLIFLSGEEARSKKRGWTFLAKPTQTSSVKEMGVANLQTFLKQLKSTEMVIQEIEEELEAYYRTLVKTRVSLLNVLNH